VEKRADVSFCHNKLLTSIQIKFLSTGPRRKPKENNFKAVLETIRELMNTTCVVPEFLHDIILGYGDPGAAHYRQMPNQSKTLDFNDTFLSFQHLRDSFPGYDVKVNVPEDQLQPPFKLTFDEEVTEEKPKKKHFGSTLQRLESRSLPSK